MTKRVSSYTMRLFDIPVAKYTNSDGLIIINCHKHLNIDLLYYFIISFNFQRRSLERLH